MSACRGWRIRATSISSATACSPGWRASPPIRRRSRCSSRFRDVRARRRSGTDRERVQELRAAAAAHAPGRLPEQLERFGAERLAIEEIGTRSLMLVPIVPAARPSVPTLLAPPRPLRRARPRPRPGACRPRRCRDGQRGPRRGAAAPRAGSAGARVRRRRRLPRRPRRPLLLWNPAAARITGLSEAEVVGAPPRPCWPAGRWAGRAAADVPGRGPHGELWLSLTAAEFPHGTVYAFRDLTEQRAVEQMKSDFVSTVSTSCGRRSPRSTGPR